MAIQSRLTRSRRCFWINIESQSIFGILGCRGQVETGHKGDSVGACSGLPHFLALILLIFRGEEPPRLLTGSWVAGWALRRFWRSWMPLLTRPPVLSGSVWSNFLPSKCLKLSDTGASSCLHTSVFHMKFFSKTKNTGIPSRVRVRGSIWDMYKPERVYEG